MENQCLSRAHSQTNKVSSECHADKILSEFQKPRTPVRIVVFLLGSKDKPENPATHRNTLTV